MTTTDATPANVTPLRAPTEADRIYQALCAPFEWTFQDPNVAGGAPFISAEQCITRLNEVLGVNGWSYRVVDGGVEWEADHCWALGHMEATIAGVTVHREQYGGQGIKRSSRDIQKFVVPGGEMQGTVIERGRILNLGDDRKGAGTDALKKCAMSLGVGLYLSMKQPQQGRQQQRQPQQRAPQAAKPAQQQRAAPQPITCQELVAVMADGQVVMDGDKPKQAPCGVTLTEVNTQQGLWSPSKLANEGMKNYRLVLCSGHYAKRVKAAQASA